MTRPDSTARFERILTGPILPTLLALTLPVIAVIFAQTFVAVLEAFWVSRLGTDAIAGVSLVLPLFVLMGTMSNGGIGGGVSSAVSRAVGAGRIEEANALLAHTIVIAIVFGLIFTIGALACGRAAYAALGGSGAALAAALTYSAWAFGGSVVIWIVNLIGSALRGAGEVRLPAIVSVVGAAVLVPLSPLLIFGVGPIPALGLAGAGIAMLIYYLGALIVYLRHVLSGSATLTLRRTQLSARHFRTILGVGLISAVGTLMASLTVVAVTGAVGLSGAAALAGFGIASRLDSLLVPLLFGLGTGVVTMVGAATGAGQPARAARVAWTAALLGLAATEVIGVTAAIAPQAWMVLFSDDAAVRDAGVTYLRTAGPAFGGIGLGLILYFACQGRGKMGWPFIAGGVRLAITAIGALALARAGFGLTAIFAAVALGSLGFGATNALGFWRLSPPRDAAVAGA